MKLFLKVVFEELKFFFAKLFKRVESLFFKMLSLAFLSWALLLYLWETGHIKFDGMEFLIFTASVIGIKAYTKIKGNQA